MQISRKENFFILAGSSGTGKSTVLNRLRGLGFLCFDEASRAVLEEQLAVNGPALPSNSPTLFVQTMQALNTKNFKDAEKQKYPVFFDRGMPDLVHYARRFDLNSSEFEATAEQYRYNKNVFVFRPWREIFINDNVRRMTFEKSVEFHEDLMNCYQSAHYNVIDVPFGSVDSRSEFIAKAANRSTEQ